MTIQIVECKESGEFEIYINGWFLCSVDENDISREAKQVLGDNLISGEILTETT